MKLFSEEMYLMLSITKVCAKDMVATVVKISEIAIFFIRIAIESKTIKKMQAFAIHLTAHHKPLSNMGMLHLMRCNPNIESCARFSGGDCEVIEQYVLHSLRNAGQNYGKNLE